MTRLNVEEFHSACASIFHERSSPALNYAVGYANVGMTLSDPKEVQVQCLYILGNIERWRSGRATAARNTFKRLSKAASWKELA